MFKMSINSFLLINFQDALSLFCFPLLLLVSSSPSRGQLQNVSPLLLFAVGNSSDRAGRELMALRDAATYVVQLFPVGGGGLVQMG